MPFARLYDRGVEGFPVGCNRISLHWEIQSHPDAPTGDAIFVERSRQDGTLVVVVLESGGTGQTAVRRAAAVDGLLRREPGIQNRPCPCLLGSELVALLVGRPEFRDARPGMTVILLDASTVRFASSVNPLLFQRHPGGWGATGVGGPQLLNGWEEVEASYQPCQPVTLTCGSGLLLGSTGWSHTPNLGGVPYAHRLPADLATVAPTLSAADLFAKVLECAVTHYQARHLLPADVALFAIEWS